MECGQCFLEWRWCAWLDGVVHGWLNNCWRVSPQLPLASICVVRFGMNTSITNSQRPRAGITSMHTPASRETIAASIELCETEVCFFAHPTYCCKRVTCEDAQNSSSCWFWIFKVSYKIRVLKQCCSALLCCVSHITIWSVLTCVMNVRDQTRQLFVASLCPFCDRTSKFVHRP